MLSNGAEGRKLIPALLTCPGILRIAFIPRDPREGRRRSLFRTPTCVAQQRLAQRITLGVPLASFAYLASLSTALSPSFSGACSAAAGLSLFRKQVFPIRKKSCV